MENKRKLENATDNSKNSLKNFFVKASFTHQLYSNNKNKINFSKNCCLLDGLWNTATVPLARAMKTRFAIYLQNSLIHAHFTVIKRITLKQSDITYG